MKTWKGTLSKVDLGSGMWVLETRDGARIPLHGPVPEDLEGNEVVVEGDSEESFGFGMLGSSKAIRVVSVEAA